MTFMITFISNVSNKACIMNFKFFKFIIVKMRSTELVIERYIVGERLKKPHHQKI